MRVEVHDPDRDQRLNRWVVPAGLALLAVITWLLARAGGHPWGDDWAGYLLQARALAEGSAAAEVATNAAAMRGSDVQLGPDAYPWGFPALLAVAGVATGWDFESMKWVGLAALIGAVLGAFLLARLLVGPWLAAGVAIVVALRPAVVVDSTYLGSDLPFLAASTLTLALILHIYAAAKSTGAIGAGALVGVVLLSVASFSIRSNGVVLPATLVFAIGLLALRGWCGWRSALVSCAVFAACFLLGALLYFRLLPDGSLGSVSYLSLDPLQWIQAGVRHANYLASLATFDLVRGPAKLVPLGVFAGLCVLGLSRRPEEGSILLVYLGMHVGLITLFPFDGGLRYYYPMLPAAFALLALGLQALRERLGDRWKGGGSAARGGPQFAVRALVLAAIVVTLTTLSLRERERHASGGPGEPFSADTRQVFRYVEVNAPADARIAFFKPRAFRYATGRVAVAIRWPRNLERVDWYVFSTSPADGRTQLDERFLVDPSSGFSLRYSVGTYRVYARTRG